MAIVDLITPWAADPTGFPRRAPPLLDAIRRQRAPTERTLPPPITFEHLVDRAGDPSLRRRLREVRDGMVERGFLPPERLALVAAGVSGPAAEPIPGPEGGTVALFLDRADDTELLGALAEAVAALTRWRLPVSPVAHHISTPWDRWETAREVPLVEWIYTAGLGLHARRLLDPELPLHEVLRLGRGALTRLRREERILLAQLEVDLPRTGVGVVMRWLEDDAPPALRRDTRGTLIPRGAGRYLAWRELRERVERVGVVEACGMSV